MLESTRSALLWMSGQDGIVMGQREVKIRLAGQMSIFNAEAQAIIEAIKITRRWGMYKLIIMTDSLSNIVAQEETFTGGNSKKMVLKDLMAEEMRMWASRKMKRRTRQQKKR
jgi:hypothetical protein